MYALGVYDKKTNSVYYSKEKDNDSYERLHTGDQIYCYNLKTGKDTMLTDDLLAVNYIVPVDSTIFFIAARQNKVLDNWSNLILGKIDLSDGSIEYWNEDKTAQTRIIAVDRMQKRIYVAISDGEEEDLALKFHYSSADAPFIPPTHTIYSYDYNLSDKREILHKDNMKIVAIYANDNKLLYSASSTMSPYPDTVIITEMIDLSNMEVLYQSEEQFSDQGCFTQDMKGVYGVDRDKDSGGIFYYGFDANNYTMIIENNLGEYNVGNFELIY